MTDITVNRDEMARLLGVSLPTFTKLLKENADLPIVSGGSRGIAYAFDPAAVITWCDGKKEEAQRVSAAKAEFLSQFEFAVDETQPDSPAAQTPAQRVQTARALKLEREMAMEAGHLVPTAGVRQALHTALAILGRGLGNLPAQLGREFNLPDAVQRAMQRRIDDLRVQTVREIQSAVADPSDLMAAE